MMVAATRRTRIIYSQPMRTVGLALLLAGGAAACDNEEASTNYYRCQNHNDADFCRKAVAAAPESKSGRAAAAWITNKEKADADKARATKAVLDAKVAKYAGLSAADRQSALSNCIKGETPCPDDEASAIVTSARDAHERAGLEAAHLRLKETRNCTRMEVENGCSFACKVGVGLRSHGGTPREEIESSIATCESGCKLRCPCAAKHKDMGCFFPSAPATAQTGASTATELSPPPVASASSPASSAAASASPDAEATELAPQDKDFVDKRGGWEWGNRCYVQLKAGHLGWAKAACNKAMAMDPASPNPRASILYNQGMIEERLGNTVAARKLYEQSLAVRPNAEVQAALKKLGN